jgi:hypothetical protein
MNRHLTLASLLLLTGAFLFLAGSQAQAGCPPSASYCTATLTGTHMGVSVFTLPDGSGWPLSACCPYGGSPGTASVTIEVTVADAAGPCTAFPRTRIRLNHLGAPDQSWCPVALYTLPDGPNFADGPTDASGYTEFTDSYHGGGWAWDTQVWIEETPGTWRPVPTAVEVHMNSADISGDLVIDLTDLAIFAGDYFGAYNYRSDFIWDGAINVADLVQFASVWGPPAITCP